MKSKMSPVRLRELKRQKNRTQIDGIGDYVDYASGYAIAERTDAWIFLVQMAAKKGVGQVEARALLQAASAIRMGEHEGCQKCLEKRPRHQPPDPLGHLDRLLKAARANAGVT